MRCLLISDPGTEKSATSLDVNVGSALDGKQWQGVAHFLEHMLFMGTQKYPNENEYTNYNFTLFLQILILFAEVRRHIQRLDFQYVHQLPVRSGQPRVRRGSRPVRLVFYFAFDYCLFVGAGNAGCGVRVLIKFPKRPSDPVPTALPDGVQGQLLEPLRNRQFRHFESGGRPGVDVGLPPQVVQR